MLSFEKFSKKAYDLYKSQLTAFTKKEVDEYFYGEEAQETLKESYLSAVNKTLHGDEGDVTEARALSCGACLSLMFN